MARTINGIVTSTAMDKTARVAVTRLKQHPLYRKQYKVTTTYLAHDKDNTSSVGDKVVITETRPISKRKRWTITSVVEKGKSL